jgi:hypothetical protein
MARNVSSVTMSNGLVADWVELYNPASTNVDLSGMVLAIDELSDTWAFPPGSFIAANGYLVVWCAPFLPGSTIFEPELNTSWRIDRAGAIYLLSPQGQIFDRIEFGPQVDDYSLGRSGNGWTLLAAPTPGAANSAPAAAGRPFIPADQ